MMVVELTDCMFHCRCGGCGRSTARTNNDNYLARIWRYWRCRRILLSL